MLIHLYKIIFTLTPAGSPSGGGQWPTIVWKVWRIYYVVLLTSFLYFRYVFRLLSSSLIVSGIPCSFWLSRDLNWFRRNSARNMLVQQVRHDYAQLWSRHSQVLTSKPRAGFCIIDEENDATLKPGELYAIVEVRTHLDNILLSSSWILLAEKPCRFTRYPGGQRLRFACFDPAGDTAWEYWHCRT